MLTLQEFLPSFAIVINSTYISILSRDNCLYKVSTIPKKRKALQCAFLLCLQEMEEERERNRESA